jgi:hypothetical protein
MFDQRAVELVTDITRLLNKYGYGPVSLTVEFVNSLPTLETVRIGDWHTETYVNISKAQYDEVAAEWRANRKIGAIKLLRSMVDGLGLKEAKDIVENTNW